MKIVSHEYELTWTEHPKTITIEVVPDRDVLDGVVAKLRLKPDEVLTLIERLQTCLERMHAA